MDRSDPDVGGSGRLLSVRRSLASLAAGLVVGGAVGVTASPRLAPLVTWTVTVAILLSWVWRHSWPQGADGTRTLARDEGTHRSTDVWIVVAAVSSLAIVVVAMVQSSSQQDGTAVATVILSVLSVTLSWALVDTVFAFKYARMYYVDPPRERGFTIDAEGPPAYVDVAYMAFTVGMSFAVSDTEPAATSTRRVVLLHALLSYGFGTGVLAVSINLVTNLGQ